MSPCRHSLLGFAVGLLVAFARTTPAADARPLETIKSGVGESASLVIPDLGELESLAEARGASGFRRDLRISLFQQIGAMSAVHLRVLSNAAGRVTVAAKTDDWVARRAASRNIPEPDRAVIAGILLQTDLLEAALEKRDPSRLQTLQKTRNRKISRTKEDQIFGDLRDHVFLFCMNELRVVAELQAALGAESAEEWFKPARPRTPGEAEANLLEGVTRLARRAARVP